MTTSTCGKRRPQRCKSTITESGTMQRWTSQLNWLSHTSYLDEVFEYTDCLSWARPCFVFSCGQTVPVLSSHLHNARTATRPSISYFVRAGDPDVGIVDYMR